MDAEVIAIGDELTSGQRLDTNSQWISQRLGQVGIRTLYHTTVGDDLDAGVAAYRNAIQRADVVISTGGLGPTADDLTREALAQATARPLDERREAREHIERVFARRGRPMPEQNRRQALFPMGSRIVPNPHGTAPGIDLMYPRAGRRPVRIFALPGVPAEMHEMWRDTVVPELTKLVGAEKKVICHRRLKCFGVGESDLEAMLPDLIARGREPTVGITVHKATITLRITATGSSEAECEKRIQPTVELIREKLGDLVFGVEDDELESAVAQLLVQRGRTLATVEWGTSGILSQWLGNHQQSHDFFRGGLVLRHPDQVAPIFGGELAPFAADPAEAVQRVAQAAVRYFSADYALVVGPEPELSDDATILLGLATAATAVVEPKKYLGHPDILRERAAKQALNHLRLLLARES